MTKSKSQESLQWDTALPFITVERHTETGNEKFIVNNEAIEYLHSLQHTKVGVVSIAGMYRTGKSYLLNQIMGLPRGFAVGPTVKACTKGIWIWGKAVEIEGTDMTILFLDTEGLGSTNRSETYDCRIFALALLLSSYFVYNSVGTIDGSAIGRLSLVVSLTKHIHVRSRQGEEDTGTEYNQFFPHFLWVVRDFSVKLERDGHRISSREYLDDALRPETSTSEASEQKNAVRLLLRNFFPERDCITMVRPVNDEKQLADLANQSEDQLRPEFKRQLDALRKRVFNTVRPKTMYGQPLNGSMLADLALAYTAAINENQTPTISTAWDRVVQSQCTDAVRAAVEAYNSYMTQELNHEEESNDQLSLKNVFDVSDLRQVHIHALREARATFRTRAVKDLDRIVQFEEDLSEKIEQAYSTFDLHNMEHSRRVCATLLESLLNNIHERIATRIQHGQVKQMDTHDEFDTNAPTNSQSNAQSNAQTNAQTLQTDTVQSNNETEAQQNDTMEEQNQQSLLSILQVSRAIEQEIIDLKREYLDQAKGPAKHIVLNETIMEQCIRSIWMDWARKTNDSVETGMRNLRRTTENVKQKLANALSREQSIQETLGQEKASFERALKDSSTRNAEKQESLQALLDAKSDECERQSIHFDKSLSTLKQNQNHLEQQLEEKKDEIKNLRDQLDTLHAEMTTKLIDRLKATEALVEAKEKQIQLQKTITDLQESLSEQKQNVAVAEEKVKTAEHETLRLREETELLFESLDTQKNLVAARTEEKEECEYQWGAAKAKLAQKESEKLALEADVTTLECLAAAMKEKLISVGKIRSLQLDALERKRLDEL